MRRIHLQLLSLGAVTALAGACDGNAGDHKDSSGQDSTLEGGDGEDGGDDEDAGSSHQSGADGSGEGDGDGEGGGDGDTAAEDDSDTPKDSEGQEASADDDDSATEDGEAEGSGDTGSSESSGDDGDEGDEGDSSEASSSEDETGDDTGGDGMHRAWDEFDPDNTDIYLEGDRVVIETNGLPNHVTPYWGRGHALYSDPLPGWRATPSLIPGFDGSATLRVDQKPQLADRPTATSLGAIGIAVSGAAIFNDEEGRGPLAGEADTLDFSGGHIGPREYHYHTEPEAWSKDDENLVGVLSDGFFIYGRKCNSTGDYPADLDASGGHVHTTQHSDGPEYHYHIVNEIYLDKYYIIFPGDYMGTPNSIN